jgi:UrcA family protein
MKQSILYALFSALITAAFLTGAPAFAQTRGGETQVSLVSTADLDIGTESGRQKLQQRIAQAARDVCGTASDSDLKGSNDVRKCRDEAIARVSGQRDALIAASERGSTIAVTATR